ncbi:MAG: DUF2577 family protein [Clostridiales bacterium]|nr:DUF2577 family protein [Clostridiales bacterium]
MSVNLIRLIKKTAIAAIENTKPMNMNYGEVLCTSPLEIRINQTLMITSNNIIKTQKVTILQTGDRVVMLRAQGGQKYLIMDVIV